MYDVIVVGARCAGAPTAMLLAQRGHRVLLVDRATFPSDTLSTHFIKPPGVAMLQRWGLLGQVIASGCPAVPRFRFDYGIAVQFIGVIAGTVPIPEFFAPGNIQRIIDTSRKPARSWSSSSRQLHFTVAASYRCRPAAIVIASSILSSRAGPHRLGEKKRGRGDRCRRPDVSSAISASASKTAVGRTRRRSEARELRAADCCPHERETEAALRARPSSTRLQYRR